jgi:hypothetical protein
MIIIIVIIYDLARLENLTLQMSYTPHINLAYNLSLHLSRLSEPQTY